MVFLRLEVKVFPPDQAPSSPGLFRSLIGNNSERTRDGPQVPKKWASFLLAVEKPEDVTLGDLACLILDEWRVLRPDQEPLKIKKLLDDANPSVDLNVGLTVEDVFVDRGKARADGHDQRAVVRVIQKPAVHCPERFPSVVQDWDSAVQQSRSQSKTKKEKAIATKFSPIIEEDVLPNEHVVPDSPDSPDIPLASVEAPDSPTNQQEPPSDSIAGTPPRNGHRSQELGSRSSLEQSQPLQSQSRKRKQSPEEDAPVKNPRLHDSTYRSPEPIPRPTVSTPSPTQKRSRVPSFASPRHRRPSITQKPPNAPKHTPGLGLGVTKSPPGTRVAMLDVPSSEPSLGPSLFPSSAPLATTPQTLQSAIRKQTPSTKTPARRSVSFANGKNIAKDNNTAVNDDNEALLIKDNVPLKSSQGTPSSSQIIYPPGFSQEKIERIRAKIEQDAHEIKSIHDKLKDPKTDPRCMSPLRQLSELMPEIKSCEGRASESRRLRNLRKKLARLRKMVQDIENEASFEASEKDSPLVPAEPPLPPSASKVDRSIPIISHNTSSMSEADTRRVSSVAPSRDAQEATKPEHPHGQPNGSATNPGTKSVAMSSKESPRKSPIKPDLQSTPAVVIHTPPQQSSKTARTQREASKSLLKRPQGSIEISIVHDDEDKSADTSENGEREEGQEEDEHGDDAHDAHKTAAPTKKSDKHLIHGIDKADEEVDEADEDEEKADKPAKDPVHSFVDDEAEEQEEDENEEEEDEEDETDESSEDEDENEAEDEDSSDESYTESTSDKANLARGSKHRDDAPKIDLPPLSSQSHVIAISPTQGPSRPLSSQSQKTPTTRTTLKGLLQSQKAEQAARQKQPRAVTSQPQAKGDIYAVPSSSESESGSSDSEDNSEQEDMGDILPNGDTHKMRRPSTLRKRS